jgi:hypothetical protein
METPKQFIEARKGIIPITLRSHVLAKLGSNNGEASAIFSFLKAGFASKAVCGNLLNLSYIFIYIFVGHIFLNYLPFECSSPS